MNGIFGTYFTKYDTRCNLVNGIFGSYFTKYDTLSNFYGEINENNI